MILRTTPPPVKHDDDLRPAVPLRQVADAILDEMRSAVLRQDDQTIFQHQEHQDTP